MENLIKKLCEIIKKLKNNFLARPKKKFRKIFKGPNDLGHDHALPKQCLVGL